MRPAVALLWLACAALGEDTVTLLQVEVAPARRRNASLAGTGRSLAQGTPNSAACAAPWDRTKVLGSDGEHECRWANITKGATFLGGAPAPEMCVRGYNDQVSNSLIAKGQWQDCALLATWWEFLPDQSSQGAFGDFQPRCGEGNPGTAKKFFVDIGTNIGACLMPMAARTDVLAALAFEPNPLNLFYLSQSLIRNPTVKDKVTLYPVGLGEKDATMPIYIQGCNLGNSVIGVGGDRVQTGKDAVANVSVITLDSIFKEGAAPPSYPYIHLMKLDAQGFEVKVLEGAKKLFASGAVNAIKFELATDWLIAQGTSAMQYLNKYLELGYEIYDPDSQALLNATKLQGMACGFNGVVDLVAVHARGRKVSQEQVNCR